MWTTDRAIVSSGYIVAFLLILSARGTIAAECTPSSWTCSNGDCIEDHQLCDGRVDCTDSSDETNQTCIATRCPSFAFRCAYGACVSRRSECNGVQDCADNSDELNCADRTSTSEERNVDAVPGRCSSAAPPNGRVFYESNPTIEIVDGAFVEEYTSVLYQCRAGWNLLGSNSNFCVSGSWTDPAPSCLMYCSPDSIRSDSVVAQCEYQGIPTMCHLKMRPGTIARISCAFGYRRVPDDRSDITVCDEDGHWDRQILKCEQICGQLADRGVGYVVGGERRNNAKVPWHAGIYNDLRGEGKFLQSCGGTILSNRVVVSAAHCFWDQSEGGFYDMKHFQVVVGKYYREWNAAEPLRIQKISVQRIEYLQAYRDYEKLYTADIALLVLAEAIVFRAYVVPICMEYNLQFNEKRVTGVGLVAGWGLTVSGGTPSTELKVLNMPAIDVTVCEDTLPTDYARFVTSDKFCAGYTNGQSVCQGDSGGGLVFMKTVNGKTLHYLRGIVSSGPASDMSCASDTYSVFTNVHYYSDFIAKTVNEEWSTRGATATERNVEAIPDQCLIAAPRNGQVFYWESPTIELYNDSMVEQLTSILYKCRPGWDLLGSNRNFCESGSWTNPVPSCMKYCSQEKIRSESTVAQCEYQGIPIMCDLKMLPATIARISCAFGYRRVPDDRSDITVCDDDGNWDRQVLECEQICGQLADVVGNEQRNNNNKVPWHAGIYNDLEEQGKFLQSCGGTIVSNRVVVSAAECFWDKSEGGFYDMKHFQVVVGKFYRDWYATEPLTIQKIRVQRIEYIEGYRDYEKLYTANIALLVLAEAIVFRAYVVPICMEYNLKFSEQRVTGVGLVAGWGLTVSGGTPSTELKVLSMPAIDVTVCEDTLPADYARFVTSDKFCAGYTNGQSVCQGDSGGGLVFMKTVNGETLHYLRGIVSSGPASDMSCASDTYSVFTNVHYYSEFIEETVNEEWSTWVKY